MLENVFKLLSDYGNPLPRYTGPRCLVERLAVGGCDLCQQACPHDAVHIDAGVSIDPQRCTSCGLCVQACPTGALEYDVSATLQAVRAQQSQGEATLSCSQSGAGGATLPCLGRVGVSAVVAAGAWQLPLTLLRGDCESCAVGGQEVPARVQGVIDAAQRLREATGRVGHVSVRKAKREESGAAGAKVSRRGLFGALARGARSAAAQSIPERALTFVDWNVPEERRPDEWVWRHQALKPAPAPDTLVSWPTPRVNPGCTDCPVCSNVCPTQAIYRELQPDGSINLSLNALACTGCGACERSCPPQVIVMEPDLPAAAFGPLLMLRERAQDLE